MNIKIEIGMIDLHVNGFYYFEGCRGLYNIVGWFDTKGDIYFYEFLDDGLPMKTIKY